MIEILALAALGGIAYEAFAARKTQPREAWDIVKVSAPDAPSGQQGQAVTLTLQNTTNGANAKVPAQIVDFTAPVYTVLLWPDGKKIGDPPAPYGWGPGRFVELTREYWA